MSSFGGKFGDLVREKRGIEGLTQEALAALAFGDSGRKALISDLENGKTANPQQRTVDALTTALNLTREEIAACRVGTTERPAPTPDMPVAVNLPPEPTQHFFGRDAYIDQLHQKILRGNAAVTQAMQGLGGVGKTTLALHYAHLPDVAARFPIRWWVAAETRQGLEAGLAGLGRALNVASDQQPDGEAAAATLSWLRAAPREALILYDNAEDGALLAAFLPGPTASALVTTRVAGMGGLPEIGLAVWPDEVAADFLLSRTGQTDAAAALALAQALGGLPLACEQAAAYCREAQESLGGYLTLFNDNPGAMLAEKAAGDANARTVANTFALAIDRAAADCAAARAMLSVMAHLAPDPLPLAVFGHKHAPEGLRTRPDARKAAAALTRWALAERVTVEDPLHKVKTDCLAAHRLIRLAARDGEGLEAAVRALGGAYPGDETTNVGSWPLCATLAPHVDEGWKVASMSAKGADAACRALDRSATFHEYSKADYQRALTEFSAALCIAEASHGPEATQTAAQLSNLAPVLLRLGGEANLTRARDALERALRIDEAAHGPDHPSVAIDLSNLATVLGDLGGEANLIRARDALERALRIGEAAHGPDHLKVATRLSNLANVLRDLGGEANLARAREALERALRIGEAAYGPDHPNVAILLSNLANVLGDLGGEANPARARDALERALRIDEAAHGPDHPTIGVTLVNLARVLMDLGDRAVALDLARRGYGIFLTALGPEHGHTGIAAKLVAHLGDGS